MKKNIDELIDSFSDKKITVSQLHSKLLDLYNITPSYSVSLVYRNREKQCLRCLVTAASNEDEALGIAIRHFDKEMKDLDLHMKVIIPA
ncbi:hypothetical protein [Flammeovirga sp. SJP92]|uniref:hypothetical protein n=1 Tax=Flammeovirga sp. SJP92 TaxID=1775430 RepID=UPI000787F6BB|nr:hypothetical protein [Flammeovirga sp. SJP92]KXX72759.1 hypothetical protein AVL50_32175 [Flammeovirga sp. SJP92]